VTVGVGGGLNWFTLRILTLKLCTYCFVWVSGVIWGGMGEGRCAGGWGWDRGP